METIEERATKYACDGCMPDGIECDSCYNIHGKCERDAYIAGAKAERKVLTKWNDPQEELPPIYDNVMVKYMALDGCEHVAIAWRSAGDAGGCTYIISGTGVAINSRNVIGWREIHE